MSKKLSRLDSIQIPKPCTVGWENMSGDDQTRFCNECNKRVYNLSAMTRRQAEAHIEASQGRLCAMVTRNADGTTVVADDFVLPVAHLHHIRRASPIASAVVSALMAVSPVMAAQTPKPEKPSATASAQQGEKKPGAQPQETTAKISGSVRDSQGAIITNATVTLVNQSTGDMRGTVSKDDGTFEFNVLKPALYTVQVEAPGLTSAQTNVNLQQNQQESVNIYMRLARVMLAGDVASRQQPLRTLYNESHLIVVATAGNSVKVESERETALMKTALNVISTLKGRAKKSVVYVYHWVYGERDDVFARDKKQIVFLKLSNKGKDGYEVDDMHYGVKKLSDADVTIYTQRINELAKIMQAAKPDDGQIVEWLVRCTEEKATRSEGIMELLPNFRQMGYDEVQKDRQKAEKQEGEEVEVEEEVEAETEMEAEEAANQPEEAEQGDKAYLKITSHMTQAQKERVLAVLYGTEELTDDEEDLIELAKEWQDARLAPFFIAQLRRMEAAPTQFAETIIEYLVELLDDREIEEAGDEYSENVSYEDEDEDEDRDEDEDKKAEVKAANSQTPEALKMRQQRSEELKKFLAVVEGKRAK
jgi:hypothetical protein